MDNRIIYDNPCIIYGKSMYNVFNLYVNATPKTRVKIDVKAMSKHVKAMSKLTFESLEILVQSKPLVVFPVIPALGDLVNLVMSSRIFLVKLLLDEVWCSSQSHVQEVAQFSSGEFGIPSSVGK